MHRARKRIEGLDRGLPDLEYAQAVAEEVLPLDAERRIEMEVWLALSVGSLNDRELQNMCATSDQALQRLCVRLVERLHYGAVGGGKEASAELEARRLHALLDGLALQLIRQTAESPATWACEVVRAHLRGLLTN
ncbi:hypothetical protein DLJ54_08300 [Corynebacterium heidelbergense]|uniref:BetI-type transcriptional repressor C-terminal domain-containing protein n=2 Tax=Corynebacterium heidelbergense TaxID=2055947 RepID=A0A364V4A1_9CORY|nr:hypothetical protein DLJ54_08300 [Corynebacterium heidelbergense]